MTYKRSTLFIHTVRCVLQNHGNSCPAWGQPSHFRVLGPALGDLLSSLLLQHVQLSGLAGHLQMPHTVHARHSYCMLHDHADADALLGVGPAVGTVLSLALNDLFARLLLQRVQLRALAGDLHGQHIMAKPKAPSAHVMCLTMECTAGRVAEHS